MSETLEIAGCIAATVAVAVALLSGDRRLRAAGLVLALGIALALVLGEGWDELADLRDRPAAFAAATAGAIVVLVVLAAILLRWPVLLPLALLAALPFRIPIGVGGGDDVNLLVPLYVVLGAGVLAEAVASFRADGQVRIPRPLALALLAAVAAYAVQVSYSNDVGFATRNVAFFLIPFAVMFSLLAEVRWTPRLLMLAFAVVIGESLLFAAIGLGQHIVGEIFWNDALEMSNDFHFYLRVNSLFWDPNIYGRYLAMAIVLALGVLVWLREPRRALAVAVAIAVLFAGLCVAFSQSSFISLLAGITVLAALRWSLLWTAIVSPLVAAVALFGLLSVDGGRDSEQSKIADEGRGTLISVGIDLAQERPIYGHGSGSFPEAFAEEEDVKKGENTVSHNEPVTVAAEQGTIGLLFYVGLLAVALWTLLSGMRRLAPGFHGMAPSEGEELALLAARIAIAAAFAGLLVHTIGYAGYLTDPLTWALLAIGGALAVQTGNAPTLPSPLSKSI